MFSSRGDVLLAIIEGCRFSVQWTVHHNCELLTIRFLRVSGLGMRPRAEQVDVGGRVA